MTSDSSSRNPHPAGSYAEFLQIALPLIVSAGSLAFMNVVDRAFLTILSVDAIAASMPAAMLNWTIMSLPIGIAGYTNAFISQYEGARNKERVASTVWQGLFVSVIGGILLFPFYVFSSQLFALMQHSQEVQRLESQYFSILLFAGIPMFMSTVFTSFFAARNQTSIVMWVNLFTALVNAVLDYGLIFGQYGLPEMGIRGAAIATVLAQILACILFAFFAWQATSRDGYPMRSTFKIDKELIQRMMRYGFPHGVQMLLDVGAFTAFLVLVGRLGREEQAATNLAFTLNSLAFIPLFGFGTAVMTIVGRRVGEGRAKLAKTTVWKAFYLSGGYMLVYSAIYLGWPDTVLSIFMLGNDSADYETIKPITIHLLKFVAIYSFFDAMSITFGSAIRGAGDTRFSLIFTVVGGWTLMVLPTLWITLNGRNLYECWIACTIFICVLGIGFLFRFLQGKWQYMKVIEGEYVLDSEEKKESAL